MNKPDKMIPWQPRQYVLTAPEGIYVGTPRQATERLMAMIRINGAIRQAQVATRNKQ